MARRGVYGFEGREHGQQPPKHKMMMRKMSRHPSTPLRVSAICFSACCCCRRIRSRSTSESTLSLSFRPFFQMLFCEWRQPYPVLHCPSLCLSSADVYIFPPPSSILFIPLRTMRLSQVQRLFSDINLHVMSLRFGDFRVGTTDFVFVTWIHSRCEEATTRFEAQDG